jgi:translation initiation factor 2-alpha kinase 3
LLGKGGFGEVYKAHHFLDGVDYAVKKVVLRTDMIGDGDLEGKAREFLSELRTLARLEHTNIVRYKTSWAETRPSELPGDPRYVSLDLHSSDLIDNFLVILMS